MLNSISACTQEKWLQCASCQCCQGWRHSDNSSATRIRGCCAGRFHYHSQAPAGNIAIVGIIASNYITLPIILQDILSSEQQHWLQHMLYAPYRIYCGAAGCLDETHDEAKGLSGAVIWFGFQLLHLLECTLPWLIHALAVTVLGYYLL